MDSVILSPLDREVIQILRYFCSLESNFLIIQDHEEGDIVEAYLGMKEHLF